MNFDSKAERAAGDVWVIALTGEVDLYTAPEFKQQLLDVIARGATHVIVDLTDTTFIDSTTLGVLVGGVKRLRPNDGQLSIVCSDRNITKIFEITGLNRSSRSTPTARKRSRAASPRRSVPRPWCGSSSSSCRRDAGCGVRWRRDGARTPTARTADALRLGRRGQAELRLLPRSSTPGTAGTTGPNLDQALGYSCAQGFEESTIYSAVLGQIDLAAGAMPADLVTGQDAVDVAAYVASVAGKDIPGCDPSGDQGAATTETASG